MYTRIKAAVARAEIVCEALTYEVPFLSGWVWTSQSTSSPLRRALSFYATHAPPTTTGGSGLNLRGAWRVRRTGLYRPGGVIVRVLHGRVVHPRPAGPILVSHKPRPAPPRGRCQGVEATWGSPASSRANASVGVR